MKKAKDSQAAAGKSSGMSGRDLVRSFAALPAHVCFSDRITPLQFTYNPEWFVDEDDDQEDEWDIAKYRRETEDARDTEELARIAALNIEDDGYRDA